MALIIFSLCVICFFCGFIYANYTRLSVPKFKLDIPFEIRGETGDVGFIPPGVSVYRYGYSGEVATFFMLLNVSPGYLSGLSPAEKGVTGDPVNAYPIEEKRDQ